MVFDEVDAGVGGAVAEMVGRQLHALSLQGQVLCVTHLPQVAAQAAQQLRVAKQTTGGRTRTQIATLDQTARVEELARMLGGATITERTREHAREMLLSAARQAPGKSGAQAGKTVRTGAAAGAGKPRARNGRAG
jgi:DNA repair protein RecN (Recombination protein N)